MTYVFVFLGEFGYELLNWQGVVRKFAGELSPADTVVCCSRTALEPFYEHASQYIDISGCEMFRNSAACGYFAVRPDDRFPGSKQNRAHDRALRNTLEQFIAERLSTAHTPSAWSRLMSRLGHTTSVRFVFSSAKTRLGGCVFGSDPERYGVDPQEGNIYDALPVSNNVFARIDPPLHAREAIERTLGWNLDEPFVLCQTRQRPIWQASSTTIPVVDLVRELSTRTRVVLLSFKTGRALDSISTFPDLATASAFEATSFTEQACLIHFARRCVFLTEGDFGSHIYVPPFLGRDVVSIAPADVYQIGTTPIDFWNNAVFTFGGRITARSAESVFASPEQLSDTVDEILALRSAGSRGADYSAERLERHLRS